MTGDGRRWTGDGGRGKVGGGRGAVDGGGETVDGGGGTVDGGRGGERRRVVREECWSALKGGGRRCWWKVRRGREGLEVVGGRGKGERGKGDG